MKTSLPDATPSRWDALVSILDPMTPLNANMAAALLGRRELGIEYAQEGDEDFIPHAPSAMGRIFRLGDVLVAAGEDPQSLEGGRCISREEAEAAMANRIGPPAAWFDPEQYTSADEAKKAKAESALMLSLFGAHAVPRRGRGRPSKRGQEAEAQAKGARLHRLKGFATLGDFVLNASPEDVWIVAKTLDGRPYDFLDALLADNHAPWQAMTLFEYLDAIRTGAKRDADEVFSSDEGTQIAGEMR